MTGFPLSTARLPSIQQPIMNSFPEQKVLPQTIFPKTISPTTQVIPTIPAVPLVIIPAQPQPMSSNNISMSPNVINTNVMFDGVKQNKVEPRKMQEEKLIQSNLVNNFSHNNSYYTQNTNEKVFAQKPIHQQRTEMNPMNWATQTQSLPIQSPVIIIANKPISYPSQQVYYSGNGMQNPMSAGTPTGFPITMASGIQTTLPNGNGISNGIPLGQQVGSFEQPVQIQYLTSLYAPYSNNNIFSNYYPVVYQNAPGINIQPVKSNGVDVAVQGNLQQVLNNELKPVNRQHIFNMMNQSSAGFNKESEDM